eukprot:CAMPEP_0118681398 /NCGR_PEP_ID=MMETSP0800-20121206/4916_1 /TAXON_ID=210618 ORGANISM="Striatella unipunctata, Strain CCMP2910" /NCGR_SAMPLE_ID=MMETSP0800 /ASSEMBLY_ACC=CAM_ASM_000638 /LENGTH=41 /DNA_ID= /DNA_START= /DNA_END= /DNA_ORIENTATION=
MNPNNDALIAGSKIKISNANNLLGCIGQAGVYGMNAFVVPI